MISLDIQDLPLKSKKNKMRYSKRGHVYKTSDVVKYERDLEDAVLEQWKGPPIEGPVQVDVTIQVPDKRIRDLHNLADSLMDTLEGKLFVNDSQIVELRMKKVFGKSWRLILTCRSAQDHSSDTTGLTTMLFPR